MIAVNQGPPRRFARLSALHSKVNVPIQTFVPVNRASLTVYGAF